MENSAFSTPQRQSKVGIILLSAINFGKFLRAMWPIYLIAFFRERENSEWILLAITGAAVIYFIILSILQYRNFSYFIDTKNEKFIIKKGIINKTEIGIEKNKIQEVNINQPFIHRLLKIYELEIDSPGSDKKEVKVNTISYQNALDIKTYLLEDQKQNLTEEPEVNSSEKSAQNTLKISLSSLIKYGLTANYVRSFVAIIGFVIYIWDKISDVLKDLSLEDYLLQQDDLENQVKDSLLFDFSVLYILGIAFLILVIGIGVNLVTSIFKYFGMKIVKKHDQLSLEYGLLNTKNAIISKRKVQMITELQNPIQKKLDVSLLQFNQISEGETEKGDKNAIPGCNKTEKQDLIQFIWNKINTFQWVLKPNFRRLISRNVAFVFIPIIISIFARDLLGNYWGWIVLYAVVVELLIVVSFLNNRLYYDENFIRVKSGIWEIKNKTIPTEKIQAVKVSQYFWQRRNNLGSVDFFTAGGSISFNTANYKKLKKLVNFALYKVETSKENWM